MSNTAEKSDRDAEMENVEAQLAEARERAERFLAETKALEEKIRLARGTGDLTQEARIAASPPTSEQAVELYLRKHIATTAEVARETGVSADKVQTLIKAVRPRVHNLGTPERAWWTWRVGNDASPRDLRDLVKRLIEFRPMEFRELVAATGARDGLIQGHIVELRKAYEVKDLGTPGRGRWFIVRADARDARLPPGKRSKE